MAARIRNGFREWLAYWSQFLRRPDWAIAHWQRILDDDARHPRAWHALAVLHARRGDRQRALALVDRQLSVRPDDADAWFNRGFLLQQGADHDAALVAFDRALAIDAKIDRAWYGKALSLITQGRIAEAVEPLERNTALQPMSPYGWYQLARVRHDLGQDREAEKIIRKLSGFEPKFAAQLERETGIRVGVQPG